MSKRALVSGATGFVGSHLVPRLKADGWDVRTVGRSNVDIVDTGDVEQLSGHVAAFNPDVCFHLATNFVAQHTPADINPLIEANLAFGTRLIEACSSAGEVSFVNVGTIWQHYDSAAYNPVSLYAATKQAFADIALFYAERTSVKVVNVELSDTFGVGDTRRKLVKLLIDFAYSGETLSMSPGDQLIALINVADAVDAVIHAAQFVGDNAPTFSVPAPEVLSVKDLVKRVEGVVGKAVDVKFGATDYRPREMMELWKYSAELPGWAPKVGLDAGLEEMVNERASSLNLHPGV